MVGCNSDEEEQEDDGEEEEVEVEEEEEEDEEVEEVVVEESSNSNEAEVNDDKKMMNEEKKKEEEKKKKKKKKSSSSTATTKTTKKAKKTKNSGSNNSRRRTRTFSLEESEGYTNTSKAFLLEDLVSYYPYPTLTAALRVKKGLPSIRSEPWGPDGGRRNSDAVPTQRLDLSKIDKKMKGGSHVLVIPKPESESQ